MEQNAIDRLVRCVMDAQDGCYEIDKLTGTLCPALTLEEAYLVQEELVRRRLAAGERIAGPKMGLTSRAKMEQMGVSEPIYGYVFESMVVPAGGAVRLDRFIHPKAEPEIGFVMGRDLRGPGVTPEQVMEAVESVFPAMEIIDSRYRNFQFTLPDVVADNTSAAGAVFGERIRPPRDLDLAAAEAVLRVNGREAARGTADAVLGHPAASMACLANLLAAKGECVRAGQPILTGGITEAVAFSAGDRVEVDFGDPLGSVWFAVV